MWAPSGTGFSKLPSFHNAWGLVRCLAACQCQRNAQKAVETTAPFEGNVWAVPKGPQSAAACTQQWRSTAGSCDCHNRNLLNASIFSLS